MDESQHNPLRSRDLRPPLADARPEHVVPAVEDAVAEAEAGIQALVDAPGPYDYGSTLQRLDDVLERVNRVYGYAYHLTTVRSSPELRAAFKEAQPRFQRFRAQVAAHPGLYRVLTAYAATDDAARLDPLRARHLEKTLRAMRREGAALEGEERAEVERLRVELARLQTAFSDNVLEATNAFVHHVVDPEALSGIPAGPVAAARAAASDRSLDGWAFTLQAPSYLAVMSHAEDRELRRTMYEAFDARATAGDHDNTPLVHEILRLRRQLARTLGYPTFAHFVLEERMVGTAERAIEFVGTLEARTRPYFEREAADLGAFARERLGLDPLEPWDVRFAFERMRRTRYDLDEETLRSYFALDAVQQGMFELAERLFGLTIAPVDAPERWHEEVACFEVRDEAGTLVGLFYTDWFPRADKRSGAWMNELITGGPRDDGGFDPHVGLMCGNLTRGQEGRPSLLSLDEVQTLFHEFGHLLHLLCSRVEVRARASLAAAWDFIELPSQIMENWTYEAEALALFARHVDTGAPIPDDLVERIRSARRFQQAWAQMRQLSFAAADLALHVHFDPDGDEDPLALAQRTMEGFQIEPRFASRGFLCSFTHVLSGGYASGYYSYKWAEVLDADAFGRFQQAGLFDRATGRAFVDAVLSRGDADEPIDLFRAFVGRDPDVDALIRRNLGPPPTAG